MIGYLYIHYLIPDCNCIINVCVVCRSGKTFLYWFGAVPTICVAEVDLVKQVLAERTGLFPKDYLNANMEALLGKGLVLTNGEDWKRHRKVVHPAFNLDKLKVCWMSDQAYLIHCMYKYNVITNYCIMIYIVLSLG